MDPELELAMELMEHILDFLDPMLLGELGGVCNEKERDFVRYCGIWLSSRS